MFRALAKALVCACAMFAALAVAPAMAEGQNAPFRTAAAQSFSRADEARSGFARRSAGGIQRAVESGEVVVLTAEKPPPSRLVSPIGNG